MQTVLQIIQAVTTRMGVPRPTQAFGAQDHQIVQLLGLLEEVGEFVVREYPAFECLSRRSSWTGLGTNDQGPWPDLLGTEAASGFLYVEGETMWNTTLRRPVFGALSQAELSAFQAQQPAGPIPQFQIANGRLTLTPAPTAGHQYIAAWKSKNWLTTFPTGTNNASVPGQQVVSDFDVPLIDDYIMKKGLRAFWKREKGLAYADDYTDFQMQCAAQAGRSNAKKPLYLDGGSRGFRPGILIPAGSWGV